LGLPALVVTIAANQRPTAACAARRGILTWLGEAHAVTAATLAAALRAALAAPATLMEQSRRGMELVDGGGAARVAAMMSR
ncbi:MAG TPA: UDP-2,4-diacetamido-2,4,6-trideoxy-beta-L-altropyranose hydrolase, partial [Pseudomonadota bacterium]|nr:UDP-2,4-diacetamido-2,4,6-trideoxy-beta-L-altropyranose hydrolase [Pseudomonadota bacterium]